jgi:probable rRNA maturation factor
MHMPVGIHTTVNNPTPHLPFDDMKDRVLGSTYELSLVLVGDMLSRRLNREHRGKDYPADVLAFPLSRSDGEIFINVPAAERAAKMSDTKPRNYIAYLFIHGLLHLKGLQHGSTMERKEAALLRAFGMKRVR